MTKLRKICGSQKHAILFEFAVRRPENVIKSENVRESALESCNNLKEVL